MNNTRKELVTLTNACYLCKDEYNYSSPSSLRKHLETVHGVVIPPRKITDRRPLSKKYEYTLDYDDEIPIHYACCSCFYHAKDINSLENHVARIHNPKRIVYENEDNEEENQEAQLTRSTRSDSKDNKGEESDAEKTAQEVMKLLVEKLNTMMN